MNKWKLFYCPSEIVNDSPEEYLLRLNIDSPDEVNTITSHFESMCAIENSYNWPPKWRKQIAKNLYQHTASNHRVYFGLYGREIVIFFICRKVSNKALPIDLKRASLNQKAFEAREEDDR
jgi:hypothetical protein